uniref:Uncharacterized protein n=1 Tax=Plectus sambesii TaxID=2011161 RepID=A0A914UP69_9BILA
MRATEARQRRAPPSSCAPFDASVAFGKPAADCASFNFRQSPIGGHRRAPPAVIARLGRRLAARGHIAVLPLNATEHQSIRAERTIQQLCEASRATDRSGSRGDGATPISSQAGAFSPPRHKVDNATGPEGAHRPTILRPSIFSRSPSPIRSHAVKILLATFTFQRFTGTTVRVHVRTPLIIESFLCCS